MGSLIANTESVIHHYSVHDTVIFGLSMGGMFAQAFAIKRLNLVGGLVICTKAANFNQTDPLHASAATTHKRHRRTCR